MLRRRVIPCLDVNGGRVVKGTRFVDLTDEGDPPELAERYGLRDIPLPAIFLKTPIGLQPWIGQEEINRCQSLAELKRLVESKPR